MQVVASTVRHVGGYSECRSKEELFAQVEQDLGSYWVGVLKKASENAVIDAEVLVQERAPAAGTGADAAPEFQPVPAPVEAKPGKP